MKQLLLVFLMSGSLIACQSSAANPEHGKEGHKCDKECMAKHASDNSTDATTTVLKDHVCTDACKDGNHVYAHGEKGHVCTDACKTETKN